SAELMHATTNFTVYNTDPKAAIIATFEKLPTFTWCMNLDELAIMFLVYDGSDPGDVFKNFTNIPHIINTVKQRDYQSTTELSIDGTANLGSGSNLFRVSVQRPDPALFIRLHKMWNDWAESHKGKYGLLELGVQFVPKLLTDASRKYLGGNAMQMPDGPDIWIKFLLSTMPFQPDDELVELHESFKNMTETIKPPKGLPMFVNDAAKD
ncbi:Anaphase-promoting complex subunit 23, partial [Ascosphaera pollenicola]